MTSTQNAVVLLSGGLDSTTTLAIATSRGFACYCLSFSYGQRQTVELQAAKKIAAAFAAQQHLILHLELDKIGGSALTSDIAVPKAGIGPDAAIPVTYVPGRNIIFLAHALAWAEVLDANDIFIGVNAIDYSGYPDCRPQFIEAFTKAANLGTKKGSEDKKGFMINTPLINLTKAEIIRQGINLGVDYSMTHTCYDPNREGLACGLCDACRLRLKGFQEAGIEDPSPYQRYRK